MHSEEAEGEREIQIQSKGFDGTKHYIDGVRIVVTSTCALNKETCGSVTLPPVSTPSSLKTPQTLRLKGPKTYNGVILPPISFVFHLP